MKKSAFLLIAATLLAAGCSGEVQEAPPAAPAQATVEEPPAEVPSPPSPAEARELVARSAEFSDYEFTRAALTLPLQRDAMNEPTLAMVRQLARAGWLELTADAVVLTARAQGDPRFVQRPSGFLDVVPLASKRFGEVTAVRPNADGTVAADFTWEWVPNEVGTAIDSGPLHDRYAAAQAATAKLMWTGSAWTVLSIAPQSSP